MKTSSSKTNGPLFLGVECGGTRTIALLVDDRGQSIKRVETGPANMRLMSDHQLVLHFRHLASLLSSPSALGIGMAGVLETSERDAVRAAASQVWPGIPCWVGNDLETALAATDGSGAASRGARVVIISGTGSCCYGRGPSGAISKVGGWGHVVGDRGSGYEIALHALRALVLGFDQAGHWPALAKHCLRSLPVNNPNDLVTWAQAASKTQIAALAVEVFEGAAQGNRMARQILREAAQTLAEDAVACARRLVTRARPVEFFLTSGVLANQRAFAAALARRLKALWPKAEVKPLTREGAWGAVSLATEEWLKSRTGATAAGRSGPIVPEQEACSIPDSSALSPTEQRNPRSMNLDRLPLRRAIRLMLTEDSRIPAALLRETTRIETAIRLIVRCLRSGGRLFYVGAGTSGRLGVLDASECPPTFRTAPDLVQGIMAGGLPAIWSSVEGGEDDAEAGAQAVVSRGVGSKDVVVGIAASGRTPYVWGALHAAKALHARTVLVCFNPHLVITRGAAPTLVIAPNVGPEILTGSTRLKAGTATKLLLNMFTTLAMVQLGKVVENLMVDLNPSNAKLQDRAARIVMDLTGASREEAQATLERNGWMVKDAVARLAGKKRKSP
jgi:N-acetylmuramic acid 6-phosphate etherase